MKLGSILGALSPFLGATGLLGNNAQKVGGPMLSGMSPILGMLMHHGGGQKGVQTDGDAERAAATQAAPIPNAPAAPAVTPGVKPGGMSPQRMALMNYLLQMGPRMANGGGY